MYTAKEFSIGELPGISSRTIEEHLGLYRGYVKHVNHIHSALQNVADDYARAEMQRRLGFEFGGMKNHEYYFAQLEGGAKELPEGKLSEMINDQFGSTEACVTHLKGLAKTRGVGWVMLYIDRAANTLVCTWVDEQHLGQLADVDIVLALDMWEHSFMLDYAPSEKQQYIDAFFANLNWEVVAGRV